MDAMTIAAIANTTVAILVPYLKNLGGELAEKAIEEIGTKSGDAAWRKANQIYKSVKTKFFSNPDSANVLRSLEKSPDDVHAQESTRSILTKIMSSDEGFAKELKKLLNDWEEISKERTNTIFQTEIRGDVEKFVQISNFNGKLEM